ncbi:hypothetical protein AVO45_04695 [Ruegeria marisrubri]|uniref:Uncharacterized protein n=1 Tax=Ruegeria marisrubri TaxID=1685379 RepID=A0A0X3TXH1_9RHOB|nr:hypothetical protein [Ruegeria marisrubri]KUJ80359.1 hypothetical protein AVO45_04695 [Ruegeria marisrubri]
MSKVDLILTATERRAKAKRVLAKKAPEREPLRPEDILRLAALGLCMFVAGLVILSQPAVINWLSGMAQAASSLSQPPHY